MKDIDRILSGVISVTILSEEVGEASKAVLDDWSGITDLRKELIQSAAVIVAWIESLDKRGRLRYEPQK